MRQTRSPKFVQIGRKGASGQIREIYFMVFRQRLCSRLTALWRFINFVLLLFLHGRQSKA